ncbi:MAG TPA: ATP-binding cassette domain-containing protein, partial [Burkholderiales bacterium]|nr:ATP-binding cassette domain-containing protein [Burkholderiales bacterium]
MATESKTETLLELESVVAGYGKMMVLKGASFKVARGRITTIIGPNGAGKSTVFKAVFGLLKPQSGRILFNGGDITGWTQRRLLEAGICYVPQGRNIFPELSVRHNLELGGVVAGPGIDLQARIEGVMQRFAMLKAKADA